MQRYYIFRTFAKIFIIKMSNLVQRTLSGIVYVALVVASILFHPVFFSVLFGLITMLAVREYHCLVHSGRFLTVEATLLGGIMFGLSAFCTLLSPAWGEIMVVALAIAYVLLLFFALIAELFRKADNSVSNWGNLLVSQVMIALPFSLMCGVLVIDKYVLLALFILIWLNDSGAYCVGSLMSKRKGGNHKMFPRVSPNKSWEGLIGGAVVAIGVGVVLVYFGWFGYGIKMYSVSAAGTYVLGSIFALVVVVFGTLGDLMESLFKRTLGVKDSGRFMPGHGGVLDRFDSLLLATPAVCLLHLLLGVCLQ